MTGPDVHEGVAAVREKRAPNFGLEAQSSVDELDASSGTPISIASLPVAMNSASARPP